MASAIQQICDFTRITATTPDTDFVKHGDGTVSHKKTGLVWKRCLEGQTWAPASGLLVDSVCNGAPTRFTWQQALQHVQTLNASGGFAGHADWRVPNVKQLQSIVEAQCIRPALNVIIFPFTADANGGFDGMLLWTSTPNTGAVARNTSGTFGVPEALTVDFFDSDAGLPNTMDSSLYIRLVRIRDN